MHYGPPRPCMFGSSVFNVFFIVSGLSRVSSFKTNFGLVFCRYEMKEGISWPRPFT